MSASPGSTDPISPHHAATLADRRLRKILVLALGGEGGGTLTQWVVEACLANGWPVQATSIPGVAQRSGATSYYIECLPRPLQPHEVAPPMCLAPLAGDLDLVISSELLETARALERGLCEATRTQLITSTARAFTVQERTHMADGRWDADRILNAARGASHRLHAFDMSAAARGAGTVVSAVMFGALAASGVLPLPREVCERVLAGAGKSAQSARSQASLKGFAAGWQAVASPAPAGDAGASPEAARLHAKRDLPLRQIVALGVARLIDHQDAAYAAQYRGWVESLAGMDGPAREATRTAARHLALWMAYEDVIRVADLKSRRSRFERIRTEYRAADHEPVVVRDFLKPGYDEIAAILPPRLASLVRRHAERQGRRTLGEGLQLSTSSVSGLLAMRALAALRPLRRRSSRFLAQQALMQRWVQALQTALTLDRDEAKPLATAIAALPQLIKGYGDTFERGHGHFVRVLESLVEPGLQSLPATTADSGAATAALTQQVLRATQAALASPDGQALFDALGLSRPEPRPQPIRFMKPAVRTAR